MPELLVRSFAPFLLAFQPCFTRPSFFSFWALACAWILCSGRRSLTHIIQSAQLTRFKHYCSFHRFFSQARWNLDQLGQSVFELLLPFCEPELLGAVDDTLARKSGRHIWGAGTMIPCAPLKSAPSSPSATTSWSSPCNSPCPSRPINTGPFPFWSACTASARPPSAHRAKVENWSASKPAKPPTSNIAPVPNWPWR